MSRGSSHHARPSRSKATRKRTKKKKRRRRKKKQAKVKRTSNQEKANTTASPTQANHTNNVNSTRGNHTKNINSNNAANSHRTQKTRSTSLVLQKQTIPVNTPQTAHCPNHGGGTGRQQQPLRKMEPVVHTLKTTLEQILTGCTKKVKISRKVVDVTGIEKREEKLVEIQTSSLSWNNNHTSSSQGPGPNILHTAKITIWDALCGDKVIIPTLSGVSINVNSGGVIKPANTCEGDSRTKVWNLGLIRISGVFSSEQCKYVIGAKLLEFGIDFETDIVCVTTDGAQ
ncbi:DNAJB1 [Cordylochernes scorpioides]|uniref:DNAJB1 n=1 Tax=Cordylochernes scorpioides TaxID=51811 RepID=A0ABY6L8T2_9ARAC|nr:DNAJB1 [Cordylochernes scorpioides]